MRINNPKSLAGFTKNSDDNNYKLATVGQLNTAIHDINEKFIKLLVGTTDNASNGLGGITNKCGYAWIASNGKISPDLIPSLAITNTYVIKQSTLTKINDPETNINQNSDVLELLKYWRKHTVDKIDTTYSDMQQGDIIIVTPDDSSDIINPKICGSYIITKVESDATNTNTDYTFAKLAYEDGKIVTVNDKAPTNSSGNLTLALSDILKISSNETNAKALSDNVYRINSKADSSIGDDKFRFIFNDIPYATSAELSNFIEKETRTRSEDDIYISGIVDIINNKIGANNQNIDRATSGQIYPQLKGLRTDVDYNADILDTVILSTNNYLNNLNAGLSALNKKAIELNEYEVRWNSDNLNTTVSGTNDNIAIEYQDEGETSIGIKTQSYTIWKYTFTPNFSSFEDERIITIFDENGNKIDADITRNNDKSSKIEICLDVINDEKNNNINILTNKTMKILVASTIKFKENVLAEEINIANSKSASSSTNPQIS